MDTTSALCHEALLTLARKVEAAASDGDPDRVADAARRLLDALVAHIRAEQPEMAELPSGERAELARGQQRLLDHLGKLAVDARPDGAAGGALASLLVAELTVQADDERLRGFAAVPS
jgi:hypothetical protein